MPDANTDPEVMGMLNEILSRVRALDEKLDALDQRNTIRHESMRAYIAAQLDTRHQEALVRITALDEGNAMRQAALLKALDEVELAIAKRAEFDEPAEAEFACWPTPQPEPERIKLTGGACSQCGSPFTGFAHQIGRDYLHKGCLRAWGENSQNPYHRDHVPF